MDAPYRKAGRLLAGLLVAHELLVTTHLGEFWPAPRHHELGAFWPFSIYPMFSRGGRPWVRSLVRDVSADADRWQPRTLDTLPGRPYALNDQRIDQNDIANFVGMAVLALAVATLAFRDPKLIRRTVLGLCYFFFGLGYATASWSKLVATGITWSDGRHLWMWIQERTVDTFSLTGSIDHTWLQEVALQHYLVATAILTFGLLTEFFAPLMWFTRFRPYIITALAGMHLGIWAVMKITFNANLSLLLLLAYPWAGLIDKGLQRLGVVPLDRIQKLSVRLT